MNNVHLKAMTFSQSNKAYNTLLGAINIGKQYETVKADINKLGFSLNKKQFEAVTILHNR